MKKIINAAATLAVVLLASITGCSKSGLEGSYPNSFDVAIKNNLGQNRNNELVRLEMDAVKTKYPDFNPGSFVVMKGDNELSSQLSDIDGDGSPEYIDFLTNLVSNEVQEVTIRYNKEGTQTREYKKLTHAELSEKKDYNKIDGVYTGGRFEPVKKVKIPSDHFAHDALYKYEGPGWESGTVGYRLYLDDRNRTDIFGKKVDEIVLQKVGVNDLVSDGNESYQSMQDWGRDIFKVGNSLGIGALGAWMNEKVETVSQTDSIYCEISADGPVFSDVHLNYYGWLVDGSKYDLVSDYSISAGGNLTRHDVSVNPSPEFFCTGLAKHADTELIHSPADKEGGWEYLGLFGKQTLAEDNLGIAVFYRESELIKLTEDELSHLVILKPYNGKLTYYFSAKWQQEPNGIQNIIDFRNYLDDTVLKLNSPLEINF